MRLVKYYLDCVTDEGTVVVIYSAILELGPLKIPYECIIIKHPNSRTRQFQSFRRGRLDRFGGGQWRNDYLQGSGLWEGGQDVGSQHLLQTEQGDIFWHCFTIGSDVTIVHGQNRYLGKGYGEVVEITIPIWKLPFTYLRWGRWLAEESKRYFVWVDWNGNSPVSRGWDDCGEVGDLQFEGAFIRGNNALLQLGRADDLRVGVVSESILGERSFSALFLPKGLKHIKERKYTGIARFNGECGKVIYEDVLWG